MMKYKTGGLVYIIGSVYYLIAELIAALSFNDSLINTYLYHTISELGIPNVNSPLSLLMNSAFILVGLTLLFGNFVGLKEFVVKNKRAFSVLTVLSALGVIIVGLIHGGNPLTSGYHTFGAVMVIFGGNLLLVLISRSMDEFGTYQKFSLLLGFVGLIAFWIMFFNLHSLYMPVFERLSVYTMILWSLISGRYVLGS